MDLFESFSGDPENSSANSGGMSGGISRRSVMKAGAAAAWSVPLVQVVAAAPAVAVSGSTTLSVNGSAVFANKQSTTLLVTLNVTNAGSNSADGIVATLTFPSGNGNNDWTPTSTIRSTSSEWTKTTSTDAHVHVFHRVGTVPAGPVQPLEVDFAVKQGQAGATVTIQTSTQAGNAPAVGVPITSRVGA